MPTKDQGQTDRDGYAKYDWRPAFWRQVEFAWIPDDGVFLARWISARTNGLKGQGNDVSSAVDNLMEATAMYLRVVLSRQGAEGEEEAFSYRCEDHAESGLRVVCQVCSKQATHRLLIYPTGHTGEGVVHGRTCRKIPHDTLTGGALHGENDDSPYDVDGVPYCGRCHEFLPGHTGEGT